MEETILKNIAPGQGAGRARKSRVVQTPENEATIIPEKGSKFVALKPNVACDENREYLYDRVTNDDGEGKETSPYKKRPLQFSGMPRPVSVYTVDGRSHRARSEETFYVIDWSKRPEIAPEAFSEQELNNGEWLAHWPGIAATSPKDKYFYADIVKAQVGAFSLPIGQAMRKTGFHQDKVSHTWKYLLRDGRVLTLRELVTTNIPVVGIAHFSSTEQGRAWQEHMQEPPAPPTNRQARAFFSWLQEIDKDGRPLLMCLAAYRALVASFKPIGTALVCAAADELEAYNGGSGSGKTTSIDFARGVDGPAPMDSAECQFVQGTNAGTETKLAPYGDTLISLSDFHKAVPGEQSELELSRWGEKFDAFLSSAADGKEIRPRATKDVNARQGTVISGFLVIDGEKLPPLTTSRLRRLILLSFRRGEIDAKSMHEKWSKGQAIHTAIGHAIIRYVLGQVNQDEHAFRAHLRDVEMESEQKLFARFSQEHAKVDSQIARSLCKNFARFLTGAHLALQVVNIPDLYETVFSLVYQHMTAQSAFIDSGGASTVDRSWLLRRIHLLLREGKGHALNMKNEELSEDRPDIRQWGYKKALDGHMAPQGPTIVNLSDDGQMCHFPATLLHEWLRDDARAEHIKWTYTERTFPGALVRMGIVEPEYDKQGQIVQSAQRVYIAGKRDRRLWIPAALLDIDNQDEEGTPPEPEPTTEGSRGPAGQEHQAPPVSAPVPAASVTTEGQAAARALLDEIAADGCSLRLAAVWLDASKGGIWAINVPNEWTDEAYADLETRVLTLNCELCQLLDARSTEGSRPAPAEESTEGSRGPAPARRQEHTTESKGAAQKWTGGVKRQYRELPTAFVDVESGLALCGEETRQIGPHPRLSAILAALPRGIERVYLTGGRPGDGDVDGLYSWLREPVLGGNWQAGKLHIDADLPVLSLSHPDTKQKVDVRRVAAWFGEGTYTPYQARLALATLDRLLQETFDSKARCLTTPGSTGLDLWDRSRICDYPVLSQEYQALLESSTPYEPRTIRDVIKSSSGQGRIELCPVGGRETLPGFAYLDGRFMYGGLGQGIGFGPAEHDRVSTFEPLRRGRYFIRFTVPTDWRHVGIFAVKREDSRGGWWYPGQESAGQTFETWADAAELRLALHPPHGMTPWRVEVVERLLLQSASAGHPWPLDVWCKKLVNLRQAIAGAHDIPEDIIPLLLAAARSILLHGVGSFARSMRDELVIVSPHDTAALASLPAEYGPISHDDGTWSYTRPARLSPWSQRMMHPEFSAAIWARCRTHLLYSAKKQGRGQIAYETGAFLMPRDWLVGFRTDAIYATSDPHWPDDGVTPGQFRLKGYINGSCPQPGIAGQATTEKDYRLLNTLRDKSEACLKDYKG